MQTAAEIAAELADLYTARASLATGMQIEQTDRNGRRLRFTRMTLSELNAYIQQREADLQQAQNAEAGQSRRFAVGTYF